MVKKIITAAVAAVVIISAGGAAYADSCGVFDRDNAAAEKVIDSYMTSMMRTYSGEENVSFRGIVKEGCDFWYYNDHNAAVIGERSRREGGAKFADYSLDIDDIDYKNRQYTVTATVTQNLRYKNDPDITTTVCTHTFTIVRDKRGMLITNDVSDNEKYLEYDNNDLM